MLHKLLTAGLALGVVFAASGAVAEEFLVGVEIPLTGSTARAGRDNHDGLTVAAEVFNQRSSRHKIKLVTIDDESQPAKAVAAVEKLASKGVVAIAGGYGSNNIGPASEAANKAGLVYMTAGGTDPGLTTRGLKNFFRINNISGYTRAVVGLISDMGVQSVSIIHSTKDGTTELAVDVERTLGARGVKLTLHPFDPAITDFKPVINKIKLRDKSDVILMAGYENDYVGIIRAAKVLKPAVKAMVGAWSLATAKMAAEFPELMPNIYGTALLPFPAVFTTTEGKEFADTYRKLFGKEPDYVGQFGFVQGILLYEAIARAADHGTLSKGGLAGELRKTDRDTLLGRVQFDTNGDNPHFSHRMGQHQAGKVVIVWPKEHATGKMNFPAVPW